MDRGVKAKAFNALQKATRWQQNLLVYTFNEEKL